MDVVCFSFDCTFNDDGSSNCNTTDPKYSKTTTSTPTIQPAPLPTRRTSHPISTPTTQPAPLPTRNLTSISTPIIPEPKSSGKASTTTVPTEGPTLPHPSSPRPTGVTTPVLKPSPGKPSLTPISTWKPTSSHPSSRKPTEATTPESSRPTVTNVTLPHRVTTPVSVTTTGNNSRLSDPPMPHKGTSHPPGGSAGGKSIIIPCSVVGFVIVFLFVSIGIIRRHRNRRRSSGDRQQLDSEAECDLTFEDPSFQFNVQTRYVQPITGHDDPRFPIDDRSDTEDNDSERPRLHDLSSNDSDNLETSPTVDVDEVIFDASTVRQKQRKHGGNNSGLV